MARKDLFRLDKAAFMTEIGEKTQIAAFNAQSVRWQSHNTDVAVVDANGVVTAVADGDAVITAESQSGETVRCLVSVGYHGQNPILPPTWGLYIADGEPHAFHGRMYIYGSRDNPFGNDGTGSREFCSCDHHVIWSDDLLHWTDAGVAICTEDFPDELRCVWTQKENEEKKRTEIRFLWAPDLFKAPGKEKYYMTICTNIDSGYFIAESDSPVGPFENIRRITYRGEIIHGIDPGVLTDDDGRVYISFPGEFRLGELDPASGYARVKEDSIVSVQHLVKESPDGYYGFEGPSLRKFNGKYYFIYIASRMNTVCPVRMNYLISDDIHSGWRFGGTVVDTHEYLNSINVHGSMEFFRGKYYLSYHRVSPGLHKAGPVTREMSMEEIHIREDGAIETAIMTSSGVKGAFVCGEKIQAATAAFFSGGRGDIRFVHRGTEEPEGSGRWHFAGYAYAWFDQAGQYNGFRYVDLTGCGNVTVAIRTCAPGGILQIRDHETQAVIAAVELPDTNGVWTEISAPLTSVPEGKREVTVGLSAVPNAERVEFDWFRFDA